MINNVYRKEQIINSFPQLTHKQQTEIEQNCMPHFLFYRKDHNNVEAYCTHCGNYFIQNSQSRRWIIFEHQTPKTCPKCGKKVICCAAGYGTGKIENLSKRNVCVLFAKNNDLYIRCYVVTVSFDDMDVVKCPSYDYDERYRYYYGKHGFQKWKRGMNWGTRSYFWYPMKSSSEPIFRSTMWGNADNSYQLCNSECLDKTMFKYCELEAAEEIFKNSNFYFFTYLNEYYRHPNIEYLIKGGFGDVLRCYMKKEYDYRFKIKFKSNDLKEMLGLTSEEIKMLKNYSCRAISDYKELKNTFKNVPATMLNEVNKEFGFHISELCTVAEQTKLSLLQILNYVKKHNLKYSRLNEWKDYILECKKLGYNLSDSEINRPKDLHKAHEKTTKLIKYEENKKLEERMEKRFKELLKNKCFESEKYIIIPPKSANEIINEGKKLCHCVGGYAERHANSTCDILFLRKKTEPDVPYYTIEVRGKDIWQYRGYKNNRANNPVPDEIEEFIKEYKKFLKNRKAV